MECNIIPPDNNVVIAIANTAKAAGIRIITIGLGTNIDQNLLKIIASSTNDYHYAESSLDLNQVYQEIALTLCHGENQAPYVEAGAHRSVFLQGNEVYVTMQGYVHDDGLPSGSKLFTFWRPISGPNLQNLTWSNGLSTNAVVKFSEAGVYDIQLECTDGEFYSTDHVMIAVWPETGENMAPVVVLNPLDSVPVSPSGTTQVPLTALVFDDGLGGFAPPRVSWSSPSGPGPVTFSPNNTASATNVTATFTHFGTYCLDVAADDGSLSTTNRTWITICGSSNQPADIMLLLDLTGSMSERIPDLIKATKHLSDQLIPEGHRVAICSFGGEYDSPQYTYLHQSFTTNQLDLYRAIDSVSVYKHLTYMDQGIQRALREITFDRSSGGNEPVLVYLTDGETNYPDLVRLWNRRARMAGIRIYAIDFLPEGNESILPELVSGPDCFFELKQTVDYSAALTAIGRSFCNPLNRKPIADAGMDQTVSLGSLVCLNGSGTDDGFPLGSSLTYRWYWDDTTNLLAKTTSFTTNLTTAGTHRFRFEVSDGEQTDAAYVHIDVGEPLTDLLAFSSLALVLDNGSVIAEMPGYYPGTWWQSNGPAMVRFDDPNNQITPATFTVAGTYKLGFTCVNNGSPTTEILTVTVSGTSAYSAISNSPPVITIPAHYTISLGSPLTLTATFTDDSLPTNGMYSYQWTLIDGPTNVYFAPNITSPVVIANFKATGTYQIGLAISDGQYTSETKTTVQVVQPSQSFTLNYIVECSSMDNVLELNDLISLTNQVRGLGFYVNPGQGDARFDYRGQLLYTPSPLCTEAMLDNFEIFAQISDGTIATITIHVFVIPPEKPQDAYQYVYSRLENSSVGNQPPSVNAGPDQSVNITNDRSDDVQLSGSVATASTELTIAWSQVSGPTNGTAIFTATDQPGTTVSFTSQGLYVLKLTAIDEYSTNSDTVSIYVGSDISKDPPVAQFTRLSNDPTGMKAIPVITSGLLPVYVNAVEPNITYTLSSSLALYRASDGGFVANLTPNPITGEFHDEELATVDLTRVRNGVYDMVLTVTNVSCGTHASDTVRIALNSDLKLGVVNFSLQDVTIPVNGLPVTVIRTYDSLNPNCGDFGYGWTYSLKDMDVELDEERALTYDESGNLFDMRTGGNRDITLTMPDGRRVTFASRLRAGFMCYYAEWITPPGVFAELTPLGSEQLTVLPWSQPYWKQGGPNTSIDSFDFPGFVLTTADGQQYLLAREDLGQYNMVDGTFAHAYGKPHLAKITGLHGDSLEFFSNSVLHKDSQGNTTHSLLIERNASNGCIAAIRDPIAGSTGNPVVKYEYDVNTNLVRVLQLIDRAGSGTYLAVTNTYTNVVGSTHYLLGIIDARGTNILRNSYDSIGRLSRTYDAAGYTNRIIYDLSLTNQTVIDALGSATTNVFNNAGQVITTVNPLDEVAQRQYDDNGNVTKIVDNHPLGQDTILGVEISYGAKGYPESVTDQLGQVTQTAYDERGLLLSSTDALGQTSVNNYDAMGNPTETFDAQGHITTYTYEYRGLLSSQTDPLGTITTNQYDSASQLTDTQTGWNSNGVFVCLQKTAMTYDANGNLRTRTIYRTLPSGTVQSLRTRYFYDGQNRVIDVIEPDGYTNKTRYNAIGKVDYTVDKMGRTNQFIYDARGLLITNIFPDQTRIAYAYDAMGRKTNQWDQLNRSTSYQYDAVGRLLCTVYADGTSNSTTYNALGQVETVIDENGLVTAYQYDYAGRRIQQSGADGIHTTVNAYDAAGNITNMTRGTYWEDYVYDSLNRCIQTTYPNGTRKRSYFDAGGRRIVEMDQADMPTWYGYDRLGRLTSVTNALAQVTRYYYDEQGNMTNQVDALNRSTTFEYDAMGRRTKRTLPGLQCESMKYDTNGNMLVLTNFNSIVITNKYDSMNRLLGRYAGATPLFTNGYSAVGLLTNRLDASGSHAWIYDTRNRVTTHATPVGTLYYGYDACGNQTNLSSASTSGVSVGYAYDAINQLNEVTDKRLNKTTTYAFDIVGNLASITYPNNASVVWSYDALNRLTNAAWTCNDVLRAGFSYTLGNAGNRLVLKETNNLASRTYTWTYDNTYRLTNESISQTAPTGAISYQFDPVGNRTNRTSTIANIGNQSLAYTTNDWITTDVYDLAGNTRTNGSNIYQYDWANRLTNAVVGGVTIDMVYDADGNRIKKTAGGVTTWYLVATVNPTGYPQVVEEHTGSVPGTVSKRYTYGLDLINQTAGSTTYYFGTDGQGSTRFLMNTSGGIVQAYAYDSYGTLIASNGVPATAYLYTGEQWDSNLGMYYLRARYYKPDLGRFWTMDSYEGNNKDPLSLHKYLYAANNPVNMVDPSGHSAINDVMLSVGIRVWMFAQSAAPMARVFRWGLVTLNAVAFVSDPGVYVSVGPVGAAEVLAADLAQLARAGGSMFRATRSAWAARDVWNTLQSFRTDMNLPQMTEAGGNKVTTALLEIDDGVWIGSRYVGKSPNDRFGLHPSLRPNAQTGSHAEASVFNQAAWAGAKSDRATLYVDRALCKACGQNGGVKSMAKALGIKELTIVTSSGTEVIVIDASINASTQVPSPMGLILEVLQATDGSTSGSN